MHLKSYRKKTMPYRLTILGATTALFLAAFVLNITSNQALYNFNLNVVPIMQQNPSLSSWTFISFMNVISNIFNPVICAGYVIIFYLISYRKLQILCFLIWFIFLSWILSLIKMAIHQARPYWIPGGQVQMLEWTCYTEFGCPSGHSMMGIILLEFMLRFFARVHQCVNKYIGLFYLLVLVMQLLVMFSRVILGMHSINQVLFGLMIGLYSSVLYYLFVESALMRIGIKIFNNPKSVITHGTCIIFILLFWAIQLLVALLPAYSSDADYWEVISNIEGCEGSKIYKSFQYKCLEDCGLLMAAFGIIVGFSWNSKPFNFAKILAYTRISWKFVARFLITIVIALIPIAIFLNPGWTQIKTTTEGLALIIWACQNVGFFFGTFFLVHIVPLVCEHFGLEEFQHPSSYGQFIKFETSKSFSVHLQETKRETELVEGIAIE